MTNRSTTIHLGFEVGTGTPVSIPLAHTFVTGQTQLSGKTTSLRAIVERSGRRALVFVTKRGETFEGRRIAPYLPREGEAPIHWRLVETILAAALGQRSMKYERLQLVNAVKSPHVATSLQGVRDNVSKLQLKAKGNAGDIYLLIGEYLDLVLPEMRALAASDVLDLQPGLNVMDLSAVGQQLQALVIRASLEHINRFERDVLTVFPEAWEFAPRSTNGPAKEPAIAMVRKGAVLGNYLLCDSQDIAGVDTVIRQGASVWILGVQREINELKRNIQTIPAGIKRPKPEEIATLELGQFYACWGKHAVKTYVQPAWMNDAQAQQVATGQLTADTAAKLSPRPTSIEEPTVNEREAVALRAENDSLKQRVAELERRLSSSPEPRRDNVATDRQRTTPITSSSTLDEEGLYIRMKERLITEAPTILRVLLERPELRVEVEVPVVTIKGDSLRGRIARLIAEGYFDNGQTSPGTQRELARRGNDPGPGNMSRELNELASMGFLTIEDGKDERSRPRKEFRAVEGMKINIVER